MIASSIACNIRLYPHHIRTILQSHGNGFERSDVYAGAMSLQDISPTLPFDVYLAYMFGGFIRRMGCRIRPYEVNAGETDRSSRRESGRWREPSRATDQKRKLLPKWFPASRPSRSPTPQRRPEVALFGDLYSRDNEVLNQDLVHFIEAHGGEVITTPYTSYVKMVRAAVLLEMVPGRAST